METEDGVLLEGIVIRPTGVPLQSLAIVCIHGFPGNFYRPLLIQMGRRLAGHGLTFVSGNTRGHDIGAFLLRKEGPPLHAGSWWELFDESPQDLAAWVDFTVMLGFPGIALVGYSLGATKVIYYQAKRQDQRVRGVAAVSAPVRRQHGIVPEFTRTAERMVAEGNAHALMPAELWNRPDSPPKPGPVSAQTYLSWARSNLDVFGLDAPEPAIAVIRCPLFVCYGTNEPDIGTPEDLEMIRRNAKATTGLQAQVFEGADHFYTGREKQLADAIAEWVRSLV